MLRRLLRLLLVVSLVLTLGWGATGTAAGVVRGAPGAVPASAALLADDGDDEDDDDDDDDDDEGEARRQRYRPVARAEGGAVRRRSGEPGERRKADPVRATPSGREPSAAPPRRPLPGDEEAASRPQKPRKPEQEEKAPVASPHGTERPHEASAGGGTPLAEVDGRLVGTESAQSEGAWALVMSALAATGMFLGGAFWLSRRPVMNGPGAHGGKPKTRRATAVRARCPGPPRRTR
ncbi:hypothetical protein DP939_11655 [Spongiactinospora rosea]|uniref:Uncharacterized protein n=1 Tax=Spongiactinospora rosea TaxID=2248750 RepID=A0A366M4C7_9ACTN|nr:hypothetical protein [Spongiactinospora rosea]RBQ20429.1 hypothetical protein DP939_11655 [Spongiactinospora rosea]